MKWQFDPMRPIFLQLVEQIKERIINQELKPGERLPSVREIAADAGVNPNTVQRAMQELEREGIVNSQRTSGRFLSEEEDMIKKIKTDLATKHLETFLDNMKRLGFGKREIIEMIEKEAE
ncbi:MAG: GntR family transcriptional regulator [Candidatus Scatomorpha sp.]|jgi:GntR family transcriptional regulator